MKLNESQFELIEECAAVFLSIENIAALLEVDYDLLIAELNDKFSEAFKRYHKARANAYLNLQKAEMQYAEKRSPFAMENMRQSFRKTKEELL